MEKEVNRTMDDQEFDEYEEARGQAEAEAEGQMMQEMEAEAEQGK